MLITSLTSVWALTLGTVGLATVAADEKDPRADATRNFRNS